MACMSFDSHRHPERYAADPAARAFSLEQLDVIAQMELEDLQDDVEVTEPTQEMTQAMCNEHGHIPHRVVADNGFTYECVCIRCGKPLS